MEEITIIGAGLAGSEAALQLADRGFRVNLHEMRPGTTTPAHRTGLPAELVCSNSLRSDLVRNAPGLLKEELRRAGSMLIRAADSARIPAGGALAVDREAFSSAVLAMLRSRGNIRLIPGEVRCIPGGNVIIAAGPLASPALSRVIGEITGGEFLYFYDAIAPVVSGESLDMGKVFSQNRYSDGDDGDYLNCPFSRDEYLDFVSELRSGERVAPREFETEVHFQGCMPVEAIADGGEMSLAFGPMKPVGIVDPATGKRPFAVVQLRRENLSGSAWNLVGFQTKLSYPEQKRVFRMIPGLEKAEFLRLGSMHRNTFIHGPMLLDRSMRLKGCPRIRFAGQITGVEGYIESVASGFMAGLLAAGCGPPPAGTALGALLHFSTDREEENYQPSNINYGLFPDMRVSGGRRFRREARAAAALKELAPWVQRLQERE
ncbi:MAG TPA: methylenetetrahydrofolate--tRNA-(uracil(54)-C(5))-methyltransferase (FADH(2)-oxidizing) TrmFO [Candidatus Sabulitectum sp.]|nr:methylenetetrahydrofolate--tRNA-(uracil(54)-C(5))-methyltransferase (FADH(2)-oxidizing) TrmFO [Candidatus Sabulitectum sp.]